MVIRTGGQSGADRAALDGAMANGLRYAGWCPAGGWAEDFPEPPGLLTNYPGLRETPSPNPRQRTAWNVRDSAATLLIVPTTDLTDFPGSLFTQECAELLYLKPLLLLDPRDEKSPATLRHWLQTLGGDDLEINVAGTRESEFPGVYALTRRLLEIALFPNSLSFLKT